jgi:transaldolase
MNFNPNKGPIMAKLSDLAQMGQSIWLDFISRSLIVSGQMQALVSSGVRGMTSNPAIFEKAISGATDYDADMQALARAGKGTEAIYEALAVQDIRAAADVLRPVYDSTGGRDGYVSLEVSPFLARDTAGTIAQARHLYETVGRPNLMIKIPATVEGLPAITASIGAGINVNVTLIFGIENYTAVAEAYMAGLEALAAAAPSARGGHPADRVASVASFFVSRLDSALDPQLEKAGARELMGKIAVDNCRLAYAEYRRLLATPRWQALAAKGTRPQRVLWASTSTKSPAYPDTLYVDELIGPDTVNTLPPETLKAFLDHGRAAATIALDVEGSRRRVQRLAGLGIDLGRVTARLQEDGVAAFVKPFKALLDGIEAKRRRMVAA